jgi:hypothetical protein
VNFPQCIYITFDTCELSKQMERGVASRQTRPQIRDHTCLSAACNGEI